MGWYVLIGNDTHGPYDSAKLKKLADAGRIKVMDGVSKSAQGPWYKAGTLPGLFEPAAKVAKKPPQAAAPRRKASPPPMPSTYTAEPVLYAAPVSAPTLPVATSVPAQQYEHQQQSNAFAAPEVASRATSLAMGVSLAGAAMTAIGVFCPVVSMPMVGQINLFANGNGDGVIALVAACGAAAVTAIGRHLVASLCAAVCAFVVAAKFVGVVEVISEMKAKPIDSNNMFAGLARAMTESVQMQWGWAILIVGVITLAVGAGMCSSHRSREVGMSVGYSLGIASIGAGIGYLFQTLG